MLHSARSSSGGAVAGRRQQQQQHRAAAPRRPRVNRAFAAASTSSSSTSSATSAAPRPGDQYFSAGDKRPVILYDGDCALCNWGVNVVLDLDRSRPPKFRLAALQSPCGRSLLRRCGRAPDDISSIVLVEEAGFHLRSEAVRRIGARLGAPLPLLAAAAEPVPLPLRDWLYVQVADNRYKLFGRTDECRLRDAGELADRFLVE